MSKLSSYTIKNRQATIKSFLENYENINNFQEVKDYIASIDNVRSRKTKLNNIIQCLNATTDKKPYEDLFESVVEESDYYTLARNASKKDLLQYIPWDDIISIRKEIKNPKYKTLLSLLTMIPPMRNHEIITISCNPDSLNYYDNKTGQLILRESKNGNSRIINLPHELKLELDKYIKNSKITGNIFELKNQNTVTAILTRIFKKPFGTSAIRKIFVSTFTPLLNYVENRKLAYLMNHKISTQQSIYKRYKEVEPLVLSKYMDISSM
jgi:hypothetical protein